MYSQPHKKMVCTAPTNTSKVWRPATYALTARPPWGGGGWGRVCVLGVGGGGTGRCQGDEAWESPSRAGVQARAGAGHPAASGAHSSQCRSACPECICRPTDHNQQTHESAPSCPLQPTQVTLHPSLPPSIPPPAQHPVTHAPGSPAAGR
jgi:hypothetical protein